jgi:mutator protein MutT
VNGLNRRNDPHNPEYHGKWEFPGGSVEFGETPEVNVAREVLEEAGLRVTPIKLLSEVAAWPVEKKNGVRYQVYLLPYVCKVEEVIGPPHDEEVLEMRWFSLDEVADFSLMPRNLELYQAILPELKEVIAKHSL